MRISLFKIRHVRNLPLLSAEFFERTVFNYVLEQFSIECDKTKTKGLALANHKEHRQYRKPIKIPISDNKNDDDNNNHTFLLR